MLTIFTTAKPFREHIAVIQRNALTSWTLLHPDIQIILFGDDAGGAEIAAELGIHHEPHVEKTEFGAMRLDYMFHRARQLARFPLCCYVNCDIILLHDFLEALQRTAEAYPKFLMVGKRWDLDIAAPLPFTSPNWQSQLLDNVRQRGRQRTPDWIDYFAFSPGVYDGELPALAIGRLFWDNWLVWKVISQQVPVIDASEGVRAVHQNHDYAHHAQATKGIWFGEEQQQNFKLIGGHRHLRTIANALILLTPSGFSPNRMRHLNYWARRAKRSAIQVYSKIQSHVLHPVLDATRPIRNALGLRKRSL
jgi:hypothetical protein